MEEAFKHYATGGFFSDACRILEIIGYRMILEGRLTVLHEYLQMIPQSSLEHEPSLTYFNAKLQDMQGHSKAAVIGYRQALELYMDKGDTAGTLKCQKDLGLHYFFSGELEKAEKTFGEIISGVLGEENGFILEVYGYLIMTKALYGEITKADDLSEKALALLENTNEMESKFGQTWIPLVHCLRYLFTGDFRHSLNVSRTSFNQSEREGFSLLLPLASINIAWSHYYLGNYTQGKIAALEGLDIARKNGISDFQYAWLQYTLALNHFGLSETAPALELAQDSLYIFKQVGYRYATGEAYRLLSVLFMRSGEQKKSFESLQLALELVKNRTLPYLEGALKIDLAAYHLAHLPELNKIHSLLSQAKSIISFSKYHLTRIHALYSYCHWLAGYRTKASEELSQAFDLIMENGYEPSICLELTLTRRILPDFYSKTEMSDDAKDLVKRIESEILAKPCLQENGGILTKETASSGIQILQHAKTTGIQVEYFGSFRVFINGKELPSDRWKGNISKMLFKYMAYYHHKDAIPKEVLMEFLWPEQESALLRKRLNVALASLRKILEPKYREKGSSSFIKRENDAYRLYLGPNGRLDTDDFNRLIKEAEKESDPGKVFHLYLRAESIYKGEFLVEDPYLDWCIVERRYFQNKYQHALVKIMGYLAETEDYAQCIDYAEKYLMIDDCSEKIYQSLMRAYHQLGDNAMVTKTYLRCKRTIHEKLACPVHVQTEQLFQKLITP